MPTIMTNGGGMIFGIDIDDVIADFVLTYSRKLSEKYGMKVDVKDIDRWNFYSSLGLDPSDAAADLTEFTEEGIYQNLDPIKDAIPNVRYLVRNHTTYFLTSRPPHARDQTERWFEVYLRHVDPKTVFHVEHKGKLIKELKITHFVDDRVHNVIQALMNGVESGVLFNSSHNRNLSVSNFPRVEGWNELMRLWGLPLDFMAPRAGASTQEDLSAETEEKDLQ